MNDIKVSVCLVTYNHEPYIAQAVESVLAQRVTFPIELVVGEDCSTDRTREILQSLAQKHPAVIRLRLAERNMGGKNNFISTFAMCRGQYVAMLEGDDFWTCPEKLQRQVAALDAHPEWAICFHAANCCYEAGMHGPAIYPVDWSKPVATIADLFEANFMATASVVFRNHLFPELPSWFSRILIGDWPLHLLNAAHGDIGFLPEVMSVYRIHRSGVWSGISPAARMTAIFEMLATVDQHFVGKYSEAIERYRVKAIHWAMSELSSAQANLDATEGRLQSAMTGKSQLDQQCSSLQQQLTIAREETESQRLRYVEELDRSNRLHKELVATQACWQVSRKACADWEKKVAASEAENRGLQELYSSSRNACADWENEYAAIMAENHRLREFHASWTNWKFYRPARELRRLYQQTRDWWRHEETAGTTQTPHDAPGAKAA